MFNTQGSKKNTANNSSSALDKKMAAGNNNSGRNNSASSGTTVNNDNSLVTNGIVNSGGGSYGSGGGLKRPLENDDKNMVHGGPNDPAKRLNLDPNAANRIKNEPGIGNVEQKYNPSSMMNDMSGGLVKPKNEPLDQLKQEPPDTKDGILNNMPPQSGNKQFQGQPGGPNNTSNQQLGHDDDLANLDINKFLDDSSDGIMTNDTFNDLMNDLEIPENLLDECFDNKQGGLDDLNLDAELNNKEQGQALNNSDFSGNNSGSANVNNMSNNQMGNPN